MGSVRGAWHPGTVIPDWLRTADEVTFVYQRPAVDGVRVTWPEWVPEPVLEALKSAGYHAPWAHQGEAADLIYRGRHVAIATGTASGKSLAYLLPVLTATYGPGGSVGLTTASQRQALILPTRQHTALYLAPTKALAHDQLRAARELWPRWRVTTLDGDSEEEERRFAREAATYILTNPDMLHYSVLPNHGRWSGMLRSLRYVVVDEAHRYTGVFGAHVSAILRRLRRLCAHYGAHPRFVFASATAMNAAEIGAKLIGVAPEEVMLIDNDTSPHAALTMVLWKPSDTTYHDAASLVARLVDEGKQTVAFVSSRVGAELVAIRAQDLVTTNATVAAYRSGYLADDRREIERRLQLGELAAVAATNALELGIDIAGLDAVVIAGFPGTLASLWQQAGRAGRGHSDALVVLVARDDPLDAYLFDHPELIFDTPVEQMVLYPENPLVLGPHLCAAAQEAPLKPDDVAFFGLNMPALADRLVEAGHLRHRPTGWYWTRPSRAVDAINLRSAGGGTLDIVDRATGRVVGSVDSAAADRVVHPGAIYLHQGEQWVVDALVPEEHHALVHLDRPGYYTQPQGLSEVHILATHSSRPLGRGEVSFGEVELTSQVTSYLRRDEITSDVWDETPLDMPRRTLRTQATWWTLPVQVTNELGLTGVDLRSGAHAAEHTAIGLLPMFAPCDRWDIGGASSVVHPDTATVTVFVHDGIPGGAGFARRGYEQAAAWWAATASRLATCKCEAGCPRCIVSPKCGNANQFLNKAASLILVRALVDSGS